MPTRSNPSSAAKPTRPRRATDVAPLDLIERWMSAELAAHRAHVGAEISGMRGDLDSFRHESRADHDRVIASITELTGSLGEMKETVDGLVQDDERDELRRQLFAKQRRTIGRAIVGGLTVAGMLVGIAVALADHLP